MTNLVASVSRRSRVFRRIVSAERSSDDSSSSDDGGSGSNASSCRSSSGGCVYSQRVRAASRLCCRTEHGEAVEPAMDLEMGLSFASTTDDDDNDDDCDDRTAAPAAATTRVADADADAAEDDDVAVVSTGTPSRRKLPMPLLTPVRSKTSHKVVDARLISPDTVMALTFSDDTTSDKAKYLR
jgi:hypothetical protein